MLQVLGHPDLLHHLVLVPVHACEHAHVRDGILHSVGQLVRVGVVKPVLDVEVHDHLGDPHDLPEQVEGVPEPRVLPLSGGQGLDRLQVEVEVEVEVVQPLAVDQGVQHVARLAADLKGADNDDEDNDNDDNDKDDNH